MRRVDVVESRGELPDEIGVQAVVYRDETVVVAVDRAVFASRDDSERAVALALDTLASGPRGPGTPSLRGGGEGDGWGTTNGPTARGG